jgi:hypothetical protein
MDEQELRGAEQEVDRSGIPETPAGEGGTVEGEPSNTPSGEFDNEKGAYAV